VNDADPTRHLSSEQARDRGRHRRCQRRRRHGARRFADAGTRHYCKILDLTAGALIIDDDEVAALAVLLRSKPNADSCGPLAFVVDPGRAHVAEKFAELTAGDRPVKVFHSLHAARRWLDEHSTIELRR